MPCCLAHFPCASTFCLTIRLNAVCNAPDSLQGKFKLRSRLAGMPLPKCLRRPVRSAASTRQSQRKKCRVCNHLDPRGHTSSLYEDQSVKEPRASLSLVMDALSLAQVKESGCRFCNVLALVLDAFFSGWRGARVKVNVDIKEKGTIKVTLGGERWKDEIAEIYAAPGKPFFSMVDFRLFFFAQHIWCLALFSLLASIRLFTYAI
jgi:hypothetical protein